ncbi:NAD-dependent epimerase/dehydratase family protein [Nocardia aurantiaca]|uniref:NAD-dependent epimerase/dehydratase family protein n=1 Tax=Nocardia aurantiaca TaxID=2675850 RepID=A0A6I3KWH3_9NOCA|nr:NAD-dependent epimerase/dehydratase family protein [Nocardia aurantiaca]MTE15183.1 NAD-dependent epimerase/dehydratase family protein [Nocardia aurantiaca]
MRILIVGATGYLGSAVAERLSNLGHEVVALVRPGETKSLDGYERRIGDLTDPGSLLPAVTPDIDAVIDVATPSGDADTDAAAIDALTRRLRGTDRVFVYTSGVWVLGATADGTADEHSATDPIPIVGYRPMIEDQVLALAQAGIRSAVIRPGIIHGRGGGIPSLLVDLAREHDAPLIIADESVHWPMVHIDDLADLFAEVVEHTPAATIWHGVTEPAVSVRDLAIAAGRAAGVTAAPRIWPLDQARAELGAAFADALALDQSVSARATRDLLSWQPQGPSAISDIQDGSYRSALHHES